MSKWISVNEELPSCSGRYLTFSWGQRMMHRTFMLLFYSETTREWSEKDCDFDVAYWLKEEVSLEQLLKDELDKR